VVHDVHGAGDQAEGAQPPGGGVPIRGDVPRSARDSGVHHRVRYVDKRSAIFPAERPHISSPVSVRLYAAKTELVITIAILLTSVKLCCANYPKQEYAQSP